MPNPPQPTPDAETRKGPYARYAQPDASFSSANCNAGKHHSCYSLKCTCSCHTDLRADSKPHD